jgi:AbrB family looped-hinge helix DNA binding protein
LKRIGSKTSKDSVVDSKMDSGRGDNRNNYRARVTRRRTITLPAELCHQLDIKSGDTIELRIEGDRATLTRMASPMARGLLRGYFASWDAVNQHVAAERRGWDERGREDSRNAPLD